jgi:EAL domain-containing protein (putative c-di-GMP-specific phosphodiesterase class I)
MSVNLSSAQLLKSDLCNDVIKVISATRCDPARFRLELTETLVMHNPQQALMTLSRLVRRRASGSRSTTSEPDIHRWPI